MVIVAYVCASEIKPTETVVEADADDVNLRWRRHSKKSENTSESVKKQKQQQQLDDNEAVTRAQLARSPTFAVNTPNGLVTVQNNGMEPLRNVLQNMPLQMKLMDPMAANNYAYNYPYQGYGPQPVPGYLYGQQNIQLTDQTNNNLIGQQPMPDFINSQQSFPNNYAPNYMGYGVGQPGLGHHGQLPYPPMFGNNLMNYGPYPGGQPGATSEHFLKPGFHNIYGQGQTGLTGMPPVHGMGMGPVPGDVSGTGQLQQIPQLPQLPQPSILNPLLGMIPFGPNPQNGFHNGFAGHGGLFPEFIRNQRSLEETKEK